MRRLAILIGILLLVCNASALTLHGLQIYPVDNVWNTKVDTLPVDGNSANYVTAGGAANPNAYLYVFDEWPINIVDNSQTAKPFLSFSYPMYSDDIDYPYPDGTVRQEGTTDHHAIAINVDDLRLYETYHFYQYPNQSFTSGVSAAFNLSENALTWQPRVTADAAGMPMLPGIIRADEVVDDGVIDHALRFCVYDLRNTYIWPARGAAGSITGPGHAAVLANPALAAPNSSTTLPPHGQRFRLKSSFSTAGYNADEVVVITALKEYGMFLADQNGDDDSFFQLSAESNATWGITSTSFDAIRLTDFEAVDESGLMIDIDSGEVAASGISASFSATPLSGTPGTTITFTDNSAGSPDNWTWNFGDGNTSTVQNPTHIYAYSGSFNVNLTIYNSTAGFDSSLRTNYIAISSSGGEGETGWNQQDIIMERIYTLTVNYKDSVTHNPIPIVHVIDSNGLNQTTSTGTFVGQYNYSVVILYASSEGYLSRSSSYVMDEDKTATVYLTAYSPAPAQNPQQNTLWSPPQVVFQVLDNNNNPIIGTPVYANAVWTTLPGGLAGAVELFQSAFGLSNSTAATILNSTTTYAGTTDSTGSVVFMMVPVIQYNVTARDTNGANYTITIMPKDQYYQIKTLNASFQNQALKQITYETNLRASVFNTSFYETPNQTIGIMGAEIYDSTGQTAGANCWWTLIDNQTTWWDNQTWALGSGLQIINKTVPIVPYQQWDWGCQTV